MQLTARWGEEEVAVEVEAECRTLAALKAVLQDALPEVDVGTVRLEVGGRELADDDDVCGLEAGSVVSLSATVAVVAAATLREEGWEVDVQGLCREAKSGDVRRCGLFLDAGVACTVAHGFDPLHVASAYSHIEVVRLLLDRGANAAKSSGGGTPLHAACSSGNVEIATLLLDRGATIDAKNIARDTSLHVACEYQHMATVTLLLDRGAAIDARGYCGSTPLHVACSRGNTSIATFLLDRGAAIDTKNGSGFVPLATACRFRYRAIITLPLDHGAAVDDVVLKIARKSDDNETIAALSRATGQV